MNINIENLINSAFLNSLAQKEWYIKFSGLVEDLSRLQMALILILALILIAYLAYKRFGLPALVGLLFVYFIAYVLYQFSFINVYQEQELLHDKHIQLIEQELEK